MIWLAVLYHNTNLLYHNTNLLLYKTSCCFLLFKNYFTYMLLLKYYFLLFVINRRLHKKIQILYSGSNFTGECDHRMSRDRSRSSRSGDVIFIDETKKPLFYLLLFYVHRLSAPGDKRWVFEVMALAFFVAASSKGRVLTLATRRYPFCCNPLRPRCVLAWSRTRGMQRHRRHRIVW